MKKLIVIILIIASVFLVACSNGQDDSFSADENEVELRETFINTEHIDTFTYIIERLELGTISLNEQLPAQMYDGRLYFIYNKLIGYVPSNEDNTDDNQIRPGLMIASVSAEGDDFGYVVLTDSEWPDVLGFRISNDVITVVAINAISNVPVFDYNIIIIDYDFYGRELSRRELSDYLPEVGHRSDMLQAVILDNEQIAIIAHGQRNNYLHILCTDTGSAAELQLRAHHQNHNSMVVLEGDRLLVLDTHANSSTEETVTVLKEVDIYAADFSEMHLIDGDTSLSLSPAFDGAAYDILLSGTRFLYGYSLETGEQMRLLDWVEIGIVRTVIANIYVKAFSEGLFGVLHHGFLGDEMSTHFYTLSSVYRDDMPEQIVLTLGGMTVSEETRRMVIDFNRENLLYRIDVIDYLELSGGNRYGPNDATIFQAAEDRFRIDLMTGRGPDIIIDNNGDFAAHGHFLDLYPFIDADRELNRSDFIPNVLHNLERADGTLPVITTGFVINVMIGTTETVGHIDMWTPSAMLLLAEESEHILYPFGTTFTRGMFITGQIWTGADFIDWDTFSANLDSDAFISLLNASTHVPLERFGHRDFSMERYTRLLRGEQLLLFEVITNVEDFQFYSQIIGEDMIILGEPTQDGGKHFLSMDRQFGINAATQHASEAWEFLRTLLMNTTVTHNFPIRIDLFEALITDATTPRYIYNADGSIMTDEDGNYRELPHFTRFLSNMHDDNRTTLIYDVYAMTESAADKLRTIVYTSVPDRIRFCIALHTMMEADLARFFDGARTAEDTARIMQNRVQIYLSEQDLVLSGRR